MAKKEKVHEDLYPFQNGGNVCNSYCFSFVRTRLPVLCISVLCVSVLPLSRAALLAFCLYFLSLWIQLYRSVPFALKHRHLSGQPSHLMALYVAFSLTYPDAVFTCLVPIPFASSVPWGRYKSLVLHCSRSFPP